MEPTTNDTPEPLNSQHILQFLAQLEPIHNTLEKELITRILGAVCELPGVDSANLMFLDGKSTSVRVAWLGLNADLKFGDWSPLTNSPWADSLQHGNIWKTNDPNPPNGLPTIEAPFQARCLLPLIAQNRQFGLFFLQSTHQHGFANWEQGLLGLLSHHISLLLHTTIHINSLNETLDQQTQQATLQPPSLSGMLHMSQALRSEFRPICTYLQHNLQALHGYVQRLQNAIDYQLDEIRLSVGNEGVQRVQAFSQQNNLEAVESDIGLLLQDCTDGIFRLRNLLNSLDELDDTDSPSTSFQLDELFPPLFPFVFNGPIPEVKFNWSSLPPLYGEKTRFQKAMLLLLNLLAEQQDLNAPPPHLIIETKEQQDQLILELSVPTPQSNQHSWEDRPEGFLFAKRVVEEHQGQLSLIHHPKHIAFQLCFPSMFTAEEESVDNSFPMELPALSALPAVPYTPGDFELDAVPLHTPSPKTQKPQKLKILLLGEDQRYMRSLRRVLSRHELFIASTLRSALDQIDGHPDLNLVLCDLQGESEACLELVDHTQNHSPSQLNRICFLLGARLKPNIQEFAHRMSNRCCKRQASSQELENFIQQHAKIQLNTTSLPPSHASNPSLDELPHANFPIPTEEPENKSDSKH